MILRYLLAALFCAPLCGSAQTATAETPDLPNPQYFPVTEKIHELVRQRGDSPADFTGMEPYSESVPRAGNVSFDMVPVPGGKFVIGSPDREKGRKPDEGPQLMVAVDPFWIGKCEMTWDLYRAFMENGKSRNKDGTLNRDSKLSSPEPPEIREGETLVDVISQPTPPYVPMHFEMSNGYAEGLPAIAMSHHAASKFCEWLTAQTGHYYRLPTEAEWEYACRAGSTTAYCFGDDPAQLGEYAWTPDNADYVYQKVGQKKPNAWGIHDMHGNVSEWCLDAYEAGAYGQWQVGGKTPGNPAARQYPRVIRGGHFHEGGPETFRSAARTASKPWNSLDPCLPKSMWYLTDAVFLGFRVVRPLAIPEAEEMHRMWNTGPEPRE